jgi:putative FmdB family regulatory protein
MPLYEYQCDACGNRFEVIQKFSDPPPDTCKVCGKGPVQRQQSSPAIQFKGSGWYITDYARKGSGDSSAKESDGKSSSDTKAAADAKADGGKKSETTSKSDSSGGSTPAPSSSSKE